MGDDVVFDEGFLERLEALRILAARSGGGSLEGSRVGAGRGGHIEFKDFRRYSPGDEIRYVDWNAYARMGKLFVKEFAREEETNVSVLVDSSASMAAGSPSKFTLARRIAAALAYVGLAGTDSVSMSLFGSGEPRSLPPMTGTANMRSIIGWLRGARAGGASDLASSVRGLAPGLRRREAVVLISDLWDDRDALAPLTMLAERGHDVAVVHLLAPDEVAPELGGRLSLRDSESGAEVRADVGRAALAEYSARVERWLEEVDSFAARYGIRYARALSTTPFEEIVLQYLTRSRVLG